MKLQPHRIIARLRHPVDIPSPNRRPPEARQPPAVNPHFIRRTQLAHFRPCRRRHIVPFAALLVHDHPRDIRRAIPLLPPSANMENCHTLQVTRKLAPTTKTCHNREFRAFLRIYRTGRHPYNPYSASYPQVRFMPNMEHISYISVRLWDREVLLILHPYTL